MSVLRSQATSLVGAYLRTLALAGMVLVTLAACGGQSSPQVAASSAVSSAPINSAAEAPAPANTAAVTETPVGTPDSPAAVVATPLATPGDLPGVGDRGAEVVIYAADLPESALSELEVWSDPAAPGGKMIGLPNNGDELDPPPENDPHATFEVQVLSGIPYRCWIHMKVGAPKGKSQANVIWVQFTDAIEDNKAILRPATDSYLTAQGPAAEGWAWVGCDRENQTDPLIHFGVSGATTVRLQAGMEGVGFDQLVLSPARFLHNAPGEAVIEK